MYTKAYRYSFPIDVFKFDDLYHRWLFSLCQAANDAELFQHLVDIYLGTKEGDIEPPELIDSEFQSILYHAIAHTYEALSLWFNPPIDIKTKVSEEIELVLENFRTELNFDVRNELSKIERLWQKKYSNRFSKVRNLLVSHYPTPKDDKYRRAEDYWLVLQDMVKQEDVKEYSDGVIFTEPASLGEGRFRHTFVDELHRTYLDSLFKPTYEKHEIDVMSFIGNTKLIFHRIVDSLLIRLLQSKRPNERHLIESNWHGPDHGWKNINE